MIHFKGVNLITGARVSKEISLCEGDLEKLPLYQTICGKPPYWLLAMAARRLIYSGKVIPFDDLRHTRWSMTIDGREATLFCDIPIDDFGEDDVAI